MDDLTDEKLLRRTFYLAKLSKNRGNGAFGAILAQGKSVLFEAESSVTEGQGDLTCHAEMNLLREASKLYDKPEFSRFTMYCSSEPCPMCTAAASLCGVGRIVYGLRAQELSERSGEGFSLGCREVLKHTVPPNSVEVVGPLLEEEARHVHGW